ncbi:hypothetical protein [Falsirhodobacter deserti]|uniref:hypothetical protein n=1 Tax=Falsirhodobacter deserti TaxID=1365611 RepID=UPI000FE3DDDB|nr:hypothetical protein [Falsirhodobacter deserti]
MTNKIDQRQIRHDPASKQTSFKDERPDDQSKQPGSMPAGDNDASAASSKYNTRDDGHSKATTDVPLRAIKGKPGE